MTDISALPPPSAAPAAVPSAAPSCAAAPSFAAGLSCEAQAGIALEGLIAEAGGVAALAARCGVTRQAVSLWRRAGRVSLASVEAVAAATGRAVGEIRPDLGLGSAHSVALDGEAQLLAALLATFKRRPVGAVVSDAVRAHAKTLLKLVDLPRDGRAGPPRQRENPDEFPLDRPVDAPRGRSAP